MCGEQRIWRDGPVRLVGSPPRVRGTDDYGAANNTYGGITPACAGNSPGIASLHSPSRDHPRVCGEQLRTRIPTSDFMGSPPRVRGTGDSQAVVITPGGITPACAGNRFQDIVPLLVFWDHPRVCGEQSSSVRNTVFPMGSPPRVRGTEAV